MIAEFLERHMSAPFPSGAHQNPIAQVDLKMLDAEVVELAESYVTRGRLTPEQRSVLERYVADLRRVVSTLPEEVRDYFARLYALGVAVLNELPLRGPAP